MGLCYQPGDDTTSACTGDYSANQLKGDAGIIITFTMNILV